MFSVIAVPWPEKDGLYRLFGILKDMMVVRGITTDASNDKVQMAFYTERRLGQDEAGWPVSIEELPDIQKKYAGWKLSQTMKITGVYG
ncbi:hypothetical protein DL98DRAFT_597892 [Cadophora sp. DSE1049]|nr:hypothetical protein DL98DRAFT_597892 [Cadophora sp. DSE1049]